MDKNIKTINFDNSFLNVNDPTEASTAGIPSIDLRNGGQWGRLPRIGGIDNDKPIHEWMNAQRYKKSDVIPIVLEVPRGFDLLPNGDTFKQAVKAMFEVHSKTITGLDSSITMNVDESDLGFSGAKFREVTGSTRASTDINITVEEKEGNPFEILLDIWCRYLLLDPDLQAPLITRILQDGELPEVWSDSYMSCTVLFIEPDTMLRKPVHAWLVCNLFPDANPDITGGKDKMANKTFKEIPIHLGGFALPPTNKRVMALATKVLNNLQLWNKDPEDILLPSDNVDPGLEAVDGMDIYYDGVKNGSGGNADGSSGSATA